MGDTISSLAKLGVIAIALGLAYLAFNPSPPEFKSLPEQQAALTFDRSEAAGAERDKLLAEAIEQGIFLKVRSEGTAAVVDTGRAWSGLAFDQKTSVLKCVAAQYGYTGKRIGSFQPKHGGLSLD
jgi:hypothetical protein